jgi:predicted permease
VLLSLIGAGFGVLLAYRGVDIIAAYLPAFSFPHEAAAGIHVNATVLIFSTALALLTGILFGISPAWQLSRPQNGPQLGQLMQAGSSRLTGKAQGQSTHRILIAGQVALTMLLLASAGTAIRGFLKLYHTPLGFDPDHVFSEDITLPKNSTKTWQQRANLQESLRRSAAETPGVTGVSISTTWFPPFGSFRGKVELSSQPNLTDAEAGLMLVSPDIFSTLHIPLLSGRTFTGEETARAAHMALVNRAFVKQFLGGADPIGQSVRSPMLKVDFSDFVSAENPDGWMQIIGVVDDARNDGLSRPVRPAIFLPYTLVLAPRMSLLGRAQSDPDVAMRTIGTRLHKLNPDLSTSDQHPLTWSLDSFAWGNERFLASLFTVFALLALTLAAAGLYSVVSYAAARRTQELGLRMALGATRANVVRLVLGSSLTMVAIGAAVGLAISIVMAHWMGNLVVGESSRNPVTLILVGCVLMLVAAIACAVPAWRATTINPMRALREE